MDNLRLAVKKREPTPSPHREGVWTGLADRRVEPWTVPFRHRNYFSEIAIAVGLVLLVTVVGSLFGHPLLAGLMALILALVALGSMTLENLRIQRMAWATAFREEFGPGSVWPVDLIVCQGEAPTGRDRGLVWVEDGRVLFSGVHTSFAVVPSQTQRESPVSFRFSVHGKRMQLNLPLDREGPGGPLSIFFWPIASGSFLSVENASDIRRELNKVLAPRAQAGPNLVGQWPPVELGPGAILPQRHLAMFVAGVTLWFAATLLLPVLLFPDHVGPAIALLLGFAIFSHRSSHAGLRRRWQAYEDSRKAWKQT